MLGSLEHLLCLSVLRLGHDAYSVKIRRELLEHGERDLSLGAIHTVLVRMESKGLVRSRRTDPTPERGGRSKRVFELTGQGERALDETHRAIDGLRRPQLVRAMGRLRYV